MYNLVIVDREVAQFECKYRIILTFQLDIVSIVIALKSILIQL